MALRTDLGVIDLSGDENADWIKLVGRGRSAAVDMRAGYEASLHYAEANGDTVRAAMDRRRIDSLNEIIARIDSDPNFVWGNQERYAWADRNWSNGEIGRGEPSIYGMSSDMDEMEPPLFTNLVDDTGGGLDDGTNDSGRAPAA